MFVSRQPELSEVGRETKIKPRLGAEYVSLRVKYRCEYRVSSNRVFYNQTPLTGIVIISQK